MTPLLWSLSWNSQLNKISSFLKKTSVISFLFFPYLFLITGCVLYIFVFLPLLHSSLFLIRLYILKRFKSSSFPLLLTSHVLERVQGHLGSIWNLLNSLQTCTAPGMQLAFRYLQDWASFFKGKSSLSGIGKFTVAEGHSLVAKWLGFWPFTAWIQSLVEELRSCKPFGVAKKEKNKYVDVWGCSDIH